MRITNDGVLIEPKDFAGMSLQDYESLWDRLGEMYKVHMDGIAKESAVIEPCAYCDRTRDEHLARGTEFVPDVTPTPLGEPEPTDDPRGPMCWRCGHKHPGEHCRGFGFIPQICNKCIISHHPGVVGCREAEALNKPFEKVRPDDDRTVCEVCEHEHAVKGHIFTKLCWRCGSHHFVGISCEALGFTVKMCSSCESFHAPAVTCEEARVLIGQRSA